MHIRARGLSLLRKSVRDFFRTKGFLRIFDGFSWQTEGFLPKAYEIFRSEMPLAYEEVILIFLGQNIAKSDIFGSKEN